MTSELKIQIGGSLRDDLNAVLEVWEAAERGEAVRPLNVLAFENWETFISVMSGERHRLLQHLHANPAKSVNALAKDLNRQYRRVHEDVSILERAGLVDRSQGGVRVTADKVTAEIVL